MYNTCKRNGKQCLLYSSKFLQWKKLLTRRIQTFQSRITKPIKNGFHLLGGRRPVIIGLLVYYLRYRGRN